MDNSKIGTWILYGILAIIGFYIVKWLLGFIIGTVIGLLNIAISIAVVVGIIWLLVMIFGRRRAAY